MKQFGGYVTCAQGTSTCEASGEWGSCKTSAFIQKSLRGAKIGKDGRFKPLDIPVACDPCDPNQTVGPDGGPMGCVQLASDAGDIPDGTPLISTDSGIVIVPTQGDGNGGVACVGLQCQVPSCPPGQTTTITGTVYDPAGINPVFNAVVMIPPSAASVQPIPAGVSSDPCGGASLPQAVTYAYSDTSGKFTLSGVPIAASVPLVIQIGRWRRMSTINTSSLSCGGTLNVSPTSTCPRPPSYSYAGAKNCPTRLPREQGDLDLSGTDDGSNIPHIAIATGGLDAIECMLYRMGVSSSEFTDELHTGRIHVFNDGGSVLGGSNVNHDASYLLGFNCPGGNCPGGSTTSSTNISNYSFETGTLAGWTSTGTTSTSNAAAIDGTWSAIVGSTSSTAVLTSTLAQTFTAPPGAYQVNFYLAPMCSNSSNSTGVSVKLKDNTTNSTTSWSTLCDWANWYVYSTAVTPGDSLTLTVSNKDKHAGATMYTYFDDVFWNVLPPVSPLLDNYDMVMLPCDGGGEYNSSNWGGNYDDPGRANLVAYAGVGGRVFSSHWGREWIERTSTQFPNGPFNVYATPGNVAVFTGDQALGNSVGVIDTSQSYGQNFDAWMKAVGATAGTTITINQDREDTTSVVTPSRQFVYYQANNWPADFTFDTPVGGTATGRVMYTDMHLANGTPSGTFPNNCPSQGSALSQQEDAAEYLIFDLGDCVSGLPTPGGGTMTQDNPVTFTVSYSSMCPSGTVTRWTELDYQGKIPTATVDGSTPSGASIVFAAQTADAVDGGTINWSGVQSVNLATETATTPTGCTPPVGGPAQDCAALIDTSPNDGGPGAGAFNKASPMVASKNTLLLTITLNPSSDKQESPALVGWQVKYDCPASE